MKIIQKVMLAAELINTREEFDLQSDTNSLNYKFKNNNVDFSHPILFKPENTKPVFKRGKNKIKKY